MCEITAALETINGNTITDEQHKHLWRSLAVRLADMRDDIKNCATKEDLGAVVKDLRETAAKAAKYDLIASVAKSKATYFIGAFIVACAFGIRYLNNLMAPIGG